MEERLLAQGAEELATRFAPREANICFHLEANPALRKISEDVFGLAAIRERDLENLVKFAAVFYERQLKTAEQKALLRAGLGFLLIQYEPNEHDYALIQRANPRTRVMNAKTKQVRDTWAFMVYKRSLLFDPEQSYSAKPGQTLRPAFRDAVLTAFSYAMENLSEFREATAEMLLEQRSRRLLALPNEVETTSRSNQTRSERVDASEFVTESIPDGSLLPTNTTVTKTWTLKNVGEVPWIGRKFRRITPLSASYPASALEVPVADTLPGETVVIAVDVTTSSVVGFSEIKFKMVDSEGNLCWPDEYPHGALMAIETRKLVWTQRETGNAHRRWDG